MNKVNSENCNPVEYNWYSDGYSADKLGMTNVVSLTYRAGYELPFVDQGFDAVVCSDFLEYIENHFDFFDLASKRLTSNGSLIASLMSSNRPTLWQHKNGQLGGF